MTYRERIRQALVGSCSDEQSDADVMDTRAALLLAVANLDAELARRIAMVPRWEEDEDDAL